MFHCQAPARADRQRNTSGAPALRQPYLRVLGIELDTSLSSSPGSRAFTPEEEEEFQQLARSEGLYERFAASVAPSIFGNADIKKAVVCLLMGGSKKILPDGGRLRGDINVLMLGDPGTAKSQLLKFVEKVSRSVDGQEYAHGRSRRFRCTRQEKVRRRLV